MTSFPSQAALVAASIWVSGCCCPVLPQPAPSSTNPWSSFSSTEGNFRASFPTKPSHTASNDGREQRYTSQVWDGQLLLRVAYELNAGVEISPEERLEVTTKTLGAQNVSILPLTLQGHAGAEAIYKTREGRDTFHFRHRIYHVGETSYQVMVVVANAQRADAEAERFFATFELLDPSRD